MKYTKKLQLCALTGGIVCAGLRLVLFRKYLDAMGLLQTGTALEGAVCLLTAVCLIGFAMAARRLPQEAPSGAAAPGRLAGGLGIALAALCRTGAMAGPVGWLWKILGFAAGAGLICSAAGKWRKKSVPFLLELAPCLFFLVHLIDHYRGWSAQPQPEEYVFDLLAIAFLTLLSYERAAGAAGLGKPKMRALDRKSVV